MIINKLLHKLYAGLVVLFGVLAFSSCESGLTYEEAPESIYSEVGVTSFSISARELFENKVYAVNWDRWTENLIATSPIGSSSEEITIEDYAGAPDGKLYVINVTAVDRTQYKTPNKGFLFDGSKFTGDFTLVDPVDNRSQYIILPVRKTELVGEIYLIEAKHCVVEPVDGAPELGKPGDFTSPRRYLVKNMSYLPAGVKQYQRLYEIRVTFQSAP